MPASLPDLWKATEDPNLRLQVKGALLTVVDIIAKENGATANHAARVLWAQAVLQDPERFVPVYMRLVVAQSRNAEYANIIAAPDYAVLDAVTNAVLLLVF